MNINRFIKLMLVVLLLPLAVVMTACDSQEASQEAEAGLKVGDTAPDFSLPASDGRTVTLSDYAEKPVLLFFHMAVG